MHGNKKPLSAIVTASTLSWLHLKTYFVVMESKMRILNSDQPFIVPLLMFVCKAHVCLKKERRFLPVFQWSLKKKKSQNDLETLVWQHVVFTHKQRFQIYLP